MAGPCGQRRSVPLHHPRNRIPRRLAGLATRHDARDATDDTQSRTAANAKGETSDVLFDRVHVDDAPLRNALCSMCPCACADKQLAAPCGAFAQQSSVHDLALRTRSAACAGCWSVSMACGGKLDGAARSCLAVSGGTACTATAPIRTPRLGPEAEADRAVHLSDTGLQRPWRV